MVAVSQACPAGAWVAGADDLIATKHSEGTDCLGCGPEPEGAGDPHAPAEIAEATVATAEQVPDLLRPGNSACGERWAALYTCARREKQFARLCHHLQIRHYLPLYEHHTGAHRRRMYQLPLFPGYLFACLDQKSRLEIFRTRGIVKTLWPDRESVLLHELRQIRTALESSVELILGPGLSRGELVRVTHGPLKGVEGMIRRRLRRRGRDRLVLNVSMLGNCVATEIDLQDVERVRKAKALDHHSLDETGVC